MITFSVNGVPIRLTEERLKHIIDKHPEMKGLAQEILETVGNPGMVQKGDVGTLIAIKIFVKTPVASNKYLNVVYKELSQTDGFVLTAYYSSSLRGRLLIWKH